MDKRVDEIFEIRTMFSVSLDDFTALDDFDLSKALLTNVSVAKETKGHLVEALLREDQEYLLAFYHIL